jgi:hypothetical protein
MTFTPNSLSQRDPRWRDSKLGFDNTLTIGVQGCALTCLAMLATGYGYPETPLTLNTKLVNLGTGKGFIGPLMVWAGLTRLYPTIAIKELYVCSDAKPVPFKRIDSLLSAGQGVMVECDRSLATGEQSHWVILTKKQADDYVMLDPWTYPVDTGPVLLGVRYGFGRPLQEVITALAIYECWVNGNEAPPIPDLPGLYVRVLTNMPSGLRMLVQPNSTATIVAVEIAGTPLLVLDEISDALAKIGVTDQWLKVRDPQGLEGYVAAWYVEKYSQSDPAPIPPEPEPEPPVPPEVLTVHVSAEVGSRGLRLRAEPNLNGAQVTILKASEPLEVLENADAARAKVGVQDQWLNVRTIRNEVGYCAAWLVVLPSVVPPPPEPDPIIPDPIVPDPIIPDPQPEPTLLMVVVSQSVGSLGLRMRAAPVSGAVLVVLKAGTKLTVLEASETGLPKVGVINQWLNVKDEAGHTGYTAAWFVELVPDAGPVVPPVVDPGSLTVKVASTVGSIGLRLRSAPNTTASVVRNLAAQTSLVVLEPAATARPKIGVVNQWLNVRIPDGTTGYVAAWFVVAA